MARIKTTPRAAADDAAKKKSVRMLEFVCLVHQQVLWQVRTGSFQFVALIFCHVSIGKYEFVCCAEKRII